MQRLYGPGYLINFGRGPPKDHLCEIISKLDQGFRRSCHLSQLLTDGQRTKTDHKSSFCHYVTGELIKKSMFKEQLELSKNLTMAQLQRFACSKKAKFHKILSGNVILTSIKGHNSVTNLRKMTANNPNIDLVSIKLYKVWSKSVHLFSRY